MKLLEVIRKGAAANSVRLAGGYSGAGNWGLGSTSQNFRHLVGKGYDNSAVYACLSFLSGQFKQSKLSFAKESEGDQLEFIKAPAEYADLIKVLRQPNPYYSGSLLWAATLTQMAVSEKGAFWYRLRDRLDRTVGLYFVPSSRVQARADGPEQDGLKIITHYDLTLDNGGVAKVEYKDMVHLRWSLDIEDPMLSYAPLAPILKEVFNDNEAQTFTAALLKNQGVPGFAISPDFGDGKNPPSAQLLESISEDIKNLTGDRRGKNLAFRFPFKIQQLSIDPDKLVLDKVRGISADRTCATFGFDPMVVGLPSTSKTYSNLQEAKEAAITDVVMPLMDDVGAQLSNQLVGMDQPYRLAFDVSGIPTIVKARQETEARQRDMDRKDFVADKITRREFRERGGLPARAGDDVYYSEIKASGMGAPLSLSHKLAAQREDIRKATEAE